MVGVVCSLGTNTPLVRFVIDEVLGRVNLATGVFLMGLAVVQLDLGIGRVSFVGVVRAAWVVDATLVVGTAGWAVDGAFDARDAAVKLEIRRCEGLELGWVGDVRAEVVFLLELGVIK